MITRTLSLRELNRVTLARQMLLAREATSVATALERLVGMQAQLSSAPYVGLWTRLEGFQRDDLAREIEAHHVVKATMMRATLHLVTANDYLRFRQTLQPALTEGASAVLKDRKAGFEPAEVIAAAQAYLAQEPRSFAEISAMLTALKPDCDVGAMRYTVRTELPLVQVPNATRWSYPGNPKFALADEWLKQPIPNTTYFEELIARYLAAFGPASVADIQTWCGLPNLKEAIVPIKSKFVIYKDEKGKELLDLPDLPLPPADIPAPERFLPEFDNILLSHQKRTRILSAEYRPKVYLPALRVAATILIDGFVQGAWKVEVKKGAAVLQITPFALLTKQNVAALTEEAEKLVRFVEPDAKTYAVQFADAG
jgi:hypothetical protein